MALGGAQLLLGAVGFDAAACWRFSALGLRPIVRGLEL